MSTRFPERPAAALIKARSAEIVLPSLPINRPVTAGSHLTDSRHFLGPKFFRSKCNESGSLARTFKMYSARSSAALDWTRFEPYGRRSLPPPPGLPPPPFLKGRPLYRLLGRRF